jgi:hypothetical protein
MLHLPPFLGITLASFALDQAKSGKQRTISLLLCNKLRIISQIEICTSAFLCLNIHGYNARHNTSHNARHNTSHNAWHHNAGHHNAGHYDARHKARQWGECAAALAEIVSLIYSMDDIGRF